MTNTTSAPTDHIGHGCPDDPTWDPETQTWTTLPTIEEMATASLVTCAADGCRMQFFLVAGRDLPTLCLDRRRPDRPMSYSPCHLTNPDLPYNTTESVRAACGTCGGDRRLPSPAGRLERAQQRSAVVRRAADRAQAARLERQLDKEGVIR